MNVIIGPPGTGKTTTILTIIEEALAKGTPPGRIGLVSFTRAAVGEAIERAAKRFGIEPKGFRYFRTLHSLGFELSGRDRKVVTEAQVAQWQADAGYGQQAEADLEGWDAARPDAVAAVWELSRSLRLHPRHAVGRWRGGEVDWRAVERYGARYTGWKQEIGAIDYTDMLEGALTVAPPMLDLLAIDEAQDLSPLQQALAARLLGAAREAYVVGDDDQAIHAWAGADAAYLQRLSEAHGYRVLSQSYRVPRLAHRAAQSIIGRVQRRVSKAYAPRDELGQLVSADWGRMLVCRLIEALPDGAALLCRTRRQLHQAGRWLLEAGVPYRSERGGVDPLGAERQLESAVAVCRVQQGLRPRAVDLRALATHCRAGATPGLPRGTLARLRRVDADPSDGELDALGARPLLERIAREGLEALDTVDPEARRYYRRVLQIRGGVPPVLTLTTCHASKGREWAHVFIDAQMTRYQADSIEEATPLGDDEHRVAYVAATRTKSTLTIIQPEGSKPRYHYPIFRRPG